MAKERTFSKFHYIDLGSPKFMVYSYLTSCKDQGTARKKSDFLLEHQRVTWFVVTL